MSVAHLIRRGGALVSRIRLGGALVSFVRRAALAPVLVMVAVALAGCVPVPAAGTPAPAVSQAAPAAGVSQAAAALEAAYRQAGFGFIEANRPYRPSEPPDLIAVPRTVYQVVLPKDPGSGYVVIYRATDQAQAQSLATSMQQYLQSGFGETNFPTDAQFAVDVYGPAMLFGWYSPGASTDPATAASAFRVLQGFGQPYPVVR